MAAFAASRPALVPANFCSMAATRFGRAAISSFKRRISRSACCSSIRFCTSGSIVENGTEIILAWASRQPGCRGDSCPEAEPQYCTPDLRLTLFQTKVSFSEPLVNHTANFLCFFDECSCPLPIRATANSQEADDRRDFCRGRNHRARAGDDQVESR